MSICSTEVESDAARASLFKTSVLLVKITVNIGIRKSLLAVETFKAKRRMSWWPGSAVIRRRASSFVVRSSSTKWAARVSHELFGLESPTFTRTSIPTYSIAKLNMTLLSTFGRNLSRKNCRKCTSDDSGRLSRERFTSCFRSAANFKQRQQKSA